MAKYPSVTSRPSRERAAVAVESSVALLAFLLVALLGLEMSISCYRALAVNYALIAGKRFASLNQLKTNVPIAGGGTANLNWVRSVQHEIWSTARRFGVTMGTEEFNPNVGISALNICPIATPNCILEPDPLWRPSPGTIEEEFGVFVINYTYQPSGGLFNKIFRFSTIGQAQPVTN